MMMKIKTKLLNDFGGSAVEFALIAPLLLLLSFGVIDGGLLLWRMNTAEKATQMGARAAVVSSPVAGGLATYTAYDAPFNLNAGSSLTNAAGVAVPTLLAVCDEDGCACDEISELCSPVDTVAFNFIVERMRSVLPTLGPENVIVEYSYIGLGFAGRPGGAIVPAVRVQLQDFTYSWILLDVLVAIGRQLYGGEGDVTPRQDLVLPSFSTTLTGEDLLSDT